MKLSICAGRSCRRITHSPAAIRTADRKRTLCQVDPDRCNFHLGPSSLFGCCSAHLRPIARPHISGRGSIPSVSDLRNSPWMAAKSAPVGAIRPPRRHRRELMCRVVPHNFDFLSVCEKFGADSRATECSEVFCERHSSGISMFRVTASAVRLIGCRPSTMASTKSGARKAKRNKRPT